MSNIIQDIYEPEDLSRYLSMFLSVTRDDLGQRGLGDYFWFGAQGQTITIERKSWLDLASSVNSGRLDGQLRKYLLHASDIGVLIEGIAIPLMGGETAIYEIGKNPKYLRQARIIGTRYDALMAYVWRLDKEGFTPYWTGSMWGTAYALKAFVENSQKTEFTTLRRYVRTRQVLNWTPNPVIEMLMAIKDESGYILGEKRAAEVAKQYGSLWDVLHYTPEDIAIDCKGVGVNMARRLLDATRRRR